MRLGNVQREIQRARFSLDVLRVTKISCLEMAEFLTASGALRAQMACYKIPHALGVTCSRKAREAGCATCPWPTSVTYQRQKCTVIFKPSHRFKEREKRERESKRIELSVDILRFPNMFVPFHGWKRHSVWCSGVGTLPQRPLTRMTFACLIHLIIRDR